MNNTLNLTRELRELKEKTHSLTINSSNYIPLSVKFPKLIPLIKIYYQTKKKLQYKKKFYDIKKSEAKNQFNFRVARHKSLLRRKLGSSDVELQEKKIQNLELAANAFNQIVIKPNQIFSFWKLLGNPTEKRGFVDGMLIENAKPVRGIGGGLCQAANLLYWLVLHSPLEICEHHHHQVDLFPDSGRVLPFGSGAGVLYNYGDLQFINKTDSSYIISIWLDQTHIHGEIWSDKEQIYTYKIEEKNHHFYYNQNFHKVYRYNELYRQTLFRQGGVFVENNLITVNNSEVMYEVGKEKMLY